MQLIFTNGNSIRRVFIKDRQVSLVTPELGFVPFTLDLDRLNEKEMQEQMNKANLTEEDKETISRLAELGSEEAMAEDVTKDLQMTGWRCIKKEK